MKHLDDFPTRDNNHEIQEQAETAFRNAVSDFGEFIIQKEDRKDYGTDFQLEVIKDGGVANIRIHVQVKGTNSKQLSNTSVSLSVARTNLNYLLQQPNSIYVCFHVLTRRLLVRHVDDVLREYEHQGTNWRSQKSITVNFAQIFDTQFQNKLKKSSLEIAKMSRNERILFTVTPPDKISQALGKRTQKIIVPNNYEQAKSMIEGLYSAGEDIVISNTFELFEVELGEYPKDMMLAYMAEINLGIDGYKINEERVRNGIKLMQSFLELPYFEAGSLLYSIGNGWLALKEYGKARDTYNQALPLLDSPSLSDLAAQCYKNMGSAMEHLSKDKNVAITFYQRALELNRNLNEAHFALALFYRNNLKFEQVLEHLEQVVFMNRDNARHSSVQGWRIEALFNVGDYSGAFREINTLIRSGGVYSWVWPWCAKVVACFGRDSIESTKKAIKFWDSFLINSHEVTDVKEQRLLCLMRLKFGGIDTGTCFEIFKNQVLEIINEENIDAAFWYDRIGHWAQCDGNWEDAEVFYRKAFELDPERYGYCLGTALNFLGQYEKAQPILIKQAEKYCPDAQSWFQVAIASEGLNDIGGCLFAYHKAVVLDPDYDLAWFNLGGIYWNIGAESDAIKIWKEAVERFPDHELAIELKQKVLS
ncbi:DUF4365 domain-containing protein [Alteromonas sp. a30]|uniref:DUF4365 domain-containing protein n=1 Tax=Alteromonas sp. a30 TaxID=2730917 RepID=UPI002280C65C|nr:DUF4365 domain-containing protein [Alteromonas sp. a30]MCY7297416.1 DUF4365 domain-containing protein [Alteromonas sp. a30]